MTFSRLVLLALGIALAAQRGAADAPAFGISGDWNGERTDLRSKGADFQVNYTLEAAGNVAGGARRTAARADQVTLGTTLELKKLLGWPDGVMQVTFTDRNGNNLAALSGIDPLQQVQEVYGRGNIWRLTQLWLDLALFKRTMDVKLGRVTVGEDFATSSCDFQNLTFCGSLPGNVAGEYWFNWPVSQWGARLKAGIADAGYVEAGIYQTSERNLHRGFNFDVSGSNGALVVFEGAWTPTIAGRAGSYKLGGWYDTASVASLPGALPPVPLTPPVLNWRSRLGLYALIQQRITGGGKDKTGLSLFVNGTLANQITSEFDRQLAVGLSYTGLPDRPQDVIALAFGINHAATHLPSATISSGGVTPVPVSPARHSEYVVELDYQVQVVDGLSFRPNLQEIIAPGGLRDAPLATVFGLKAVLTL